MHMPIELSLYEALTEAGVKPDSARRVERQVEAAITRGQEAVRAEMHDQLMTKADGVELRAEMHKMEANLHKTISEQNLKLVTFFIAANGIMFAAMKYLG